MVTSSTLVGGTLDSEKRPPSPREGVSHVSVCAVHNPLETAWKAHLRTPHNGVIVGMVLSRWAQNKELFTKGTDDNDDRTQGLGCADRSLPGHR